MPPKTPNKKNMNSPRRRGVVTPRGANRTPRQASQADRDGTDRHTTPAEAHRAMRRLFETHIPTREEIIQNCPTFTPPPLLRNSLNANSLNRGLVPGLNSLTVPSSTPATHPSRQVPYASAYYAAFQRPQTPQLTNMGCPDQGGYYANLDPALFAQPPRLDSPNQTVAPARVASAVPTNPPTHSSDEHAAYAAQAMPPDKSGPATEDFWEWAVYRSDRVVGYCCETDRGVAALGTLPINPPDNTGVDFKRDSAAGIVTRADLRMERFIEGREGQLGTDRNRMLNVAILKVEYAQRVLQERRGETLAEARKGKAKAVSTNEENPSMSETPAAAFLNAIEGDKSSGVVAAHLAKKQARIGHSFTAEELDQIAFFTRHQVGRLYNWSTANGGRGGCGAEQLSEAIANIFNANLRINTFFMETADKDMDEFFDFDAASMDPAEVKAAEAGGEVALVDQYRHFFHGQPFNRGPAAAKSAVTSGDQSSGCVSGYYTASSNVDFDNFDFPTVRDIPTVAQPSPIANASRPNNPDGDHLMGCMGHLSPDLG